MIDRCECFHSPNAVPVPAPNVSPGLLAPPNRPTVPVLVPRLSPGWLAGVPKLGADFPNRPPCW